MQYAQGGELGTYLTDENRLSEEQCKRIFNQIIDAIKFIHGKNVVHRDLKPNNILFLDKEKNTDSNYRLWYKWLFVWECK